MLAHFRDPAVPHGAEGIHDDQPGDPVGMGDPELEREIAAPGVAEDHHPAQAEGVEHRDGVGHVALDAERAADRRGRQAPLLVPDRAPPLRLGVEHVHVVRHRRAAVQEQERRPRTADVPGDRSLWGLSYESVLGHTPTLASGASDLMITKTSIHRARHLVQKDRPSHETLRWENVSA